MRACARKYGEDEDLWGVAGLVHDFDYEEHQDMDAPDGHPKWGINYTRAEI